MTEQVQEREHSKMGRPLRFPTAIKLERKIVEYFNKCDEEKKNYTVTGMGVFLGMSRNQLIQYGKRGQFKNVIKGAMTRIEACVEAILLSGKAQAGSIFWLKNHGWSDKQEIQVNDITDLSRDELLERLKGVLPSNDKPQVNKHLIKSVVKPPITR